jgi:hypothetical protein
MVWCIWLVNFRSSFYSFSESETDHGYNFTSGLSVIDRNLARFGWVIVTDCFRASSFDIENSWIKCFTQKITLWNGNTCTNESACKKKVFGTHHLIARVHLIPSSLTRKSTFDSEARARWGYSESTETLLRPQFIFAVNVYSWRQRAISSPPPTRFERRQQKHEGVPITNNGFQHPRYFVKWIARCRG